MSIMLPSGNNVNLGVYGVLPSGYSGSMATRIDPDDFNQALAARLQKSRTEQGISYRDLEEMTGIPHLRIMRALNAERTMIVDDFDKISRALGLTPWELMQTVEQSFE